MKLRDEAPRSWEPRPGEKLHAEVLRVVVRGGAHHLLLRRAFSAEVLTVELRGYFASGAPAEGSGLFLRRPKQQGERWRVLPYPKPKDR